MATIKSFTSLEQSKKLTEILPLESADMCWTQIYDENHMMSDHRIELIPFRLYSGIGVPCWSLAALFVTLPFPVLYMEIIGGMILWCCECHFIETDEVIKIENYNNPVDACYELILKLNELHLL